MQGDDPSTSASTDSMTNETEARADGDGPRPDDGGSTIVRPDDQTPTWRERKKRTTGLPQLTYEYFERARREDQDLRTESDYVERDVLAFPAWPHETIRNLALVSFFVGMIVFLAAALPPHIGAPANPQKTPAVILPDWYLYWSFGLLKLGPLNPELSLFGGEKLMADRTYGVLANLVVVGAITIIPFLNKGSARRPVEQPFWAAVGVFGVVFAFTISAYSAKNVVPMDPHLLFDLAFLLPFVGGAISYVVFRAMREGYMFSLNRRYYRLRPPK